MTPTAARLKKQSPQCRPNSMRPRPSSFSAGRPTLARLPSGWRRRRRRRQIASRHGASRRVLTRAGASWCELVRRNCDIHPANRRATAQAQSRGQRSDVGCSAELRRRPSGRQECLSRVTLQPARIHARGVTRRQPGLRFFRRVPELGRRRRERTRSRTALLEGGGRKSNSCAVRGCRRRGRERCAENALSRRAGMARSRTAWPLEAGIGAGGGSHTAAAGLPFQAWLPTTGP